MDIEQAVLEGGQRRFRPIILTSLTTFFGLMPMILEPSVQARFLIPMAISLGFGVLFATFVTLLIIPVIYLILEDIKGAIAHLRCYLQGRVVMRDVSNVKICPEPAGEQASLEITLGPISINTEIPETLLLAESDSGTDRLAPKKDLSR